MSEYHKGLPFTEALAVAQEAARELKSSLRDAGVDKVFCIAGASYWNGETSGYPNVSISLPKGADLEAVLKKVSEVASEIESRGIRVAISPYDESLYL